MPKKALTQSNTGNQAKLLSGLIVRKRNQVILLLHPINNNSL